MIQINIMAHVTCQLVWNVCVKYLYCMGLLHLTTLVQFQFNPFNVLTVVNNHCSRAEFKPITSQRNTGYIPDCNSNLQHGKGSGNTVTPNILVRLIHL
jgi:hypothetical protein